MDSALATRLAREARKLAMECVAGTAPRMVSDSYCGCAIGELINRVVGKRPDEETVGLASEFDLAMEIDQLLPDDSLLHLYGEGLVSAALRLGPEFLPFPLLALADALEEAADG